MRLVKDDEPKKGLQKEIDLSEIKEEREAFLKDVKDALEENEVPEDVIENTLSMLTDRMIKLESLPKPKELGVPSNSGEAFENIMSMITAIGLIREIKQILYEAEKHFKNKE